MYVVNITQGVQNALPIWAMQNTD